MKELFFLIPVKKSDQAAAHNHSALVLWNLSHTKKNKVKAKKTLKKNFDGELLIELEL